ncbi:hypothetical protein Tco_0731616 [Tanacetum coccineum]
MHKVCRWWELDISSFNSYVEWFNWLSNARIAKRKKEILEGIFGELVVGELVVGDLVGELVVGELVVGDLVGELVVGELIVGELMVGELMFFVHLGYIFGMFVLLLKLSCSIHIVVLVLHKNANMIFSIMAPARC